MASAHIRCIDTDARLALPSPSMILAKAVKIGPDGDEEVSILKTRPSVRLFQVRLRVIRLDAGYSGLKLIAWFHLVLGARAVLPWNPKRQRNATGCSRRGLPRS